MKIWQTRKYVLTAKLTAYRVKVCKSFQRFWREDSGASLVETVMVLSVLSLIATGALRFWSAQTRFQQNQIIAQQTKDVLKAAQGYIASHHLILSQQAHPYSHFIDVESLQREGWLSASFVNRNLYGQQYGVLLRRLQEDQLEALVITYGGEPIPIKEGHDIALKIGAAGGFVEQEATILGALAGWHLSLANYLNPAQHPTSGHLACLLFFSRGTLVSHYLHRYALEGYPEANRMFTHLDMNQQDVRNAREVSTQALKMGEQILREEQAQTLNRLHLVQCPPGHSLSRQADGTFSCVAPVPSGMVASFHSPICPVGWSDFNEASGRVLMGAGLLGPDQYALGETGGEARHTLTIPEIPDHSHTYYTGSGEKTRHSGRPANAENGGNFQALSTQGVGGNQPHENRPPYYVVKYCRKD